MYRYEITDDNVVLMFRDGDGHAFLSQPDYPNREPWSRYQAEEWAKAKLNEMENPDSKWIAGPSPDEPIKERPAFIEPVEEDPLLEEPEVTEEPVDNG